MAIREARLEAPHEDVAYTLSWLARAVSEQERPDEAVETELKNVAVWRQLGEGHETGLAESLRNLGTYYETQGNLAESVRARREAAALFEQQFGSTDPQSIAALTTLGVVLLRDYSERFAIPKRLNPNLRSG